MTTDEYEKQIHLQRLHTRHHFLMHERLTRYITDSADRKFLYYCGIACNTDLTEQEQVDVYILLHVSCRQTKLCTGFKNVLRVLCFQLSLYVCLCVNQGGINHNRYIQRLVFLHGDTHTPLDIFPTHFPLSICVS